MTEGHLEQEVLGWLADVGYTPLDGPDLAPDGSRPERGHYREVVLEGRLRSAIARLNPAIPAPAREDALRQVPTQLRERFGPRFDELDHTGRLVMATAAIERVVSHGRLQEICEAHSHDLSLLLARLVRQGMLESDGRSRGTVYFLPGDSIPTPDQVFAGTAFSTLNAGGQRRDPECLELSSEHSKVSSEHSALSFEHSSSGHQTSERDHAGRMLTPHLNAPIVDDLTNLTEDYRAHLEHLAVEPRQGRLSAARMEQVILALCRDQFMPLAVLADLLDRHPASLRQQYLTRMVRAGPHTTCFPDPPHPREAGLPGCRVR